MIAAQNPWSISFSMPLNYDLYHALPVVRFDDQDKVLGLYDPANCSVDGLPMKKLSAVMIIMPGEMIPHGLT